MKTPPQTPHRRRSIRLKGYDYSRAGLYFITICTHGRKRIFGEIGDGVMALNDAGRVVETCWLAIPDHYPNARLHEYVIMPNHVHSIVGVQDFEPLRESCQNRFQKIIPRSIGAMVRGFKIGVTKWFRQNTTRHTVWQRNYYEHIIRNESSYTHLSQYIQTNPLKWREDTYFER